MASIVGMVNVDTLKARQDAARRERNNRPLTQRPFAEAFRGLTVKKGKIVERKDKR